MRKKYSKADLRHIAEDMIEDLRECEDGTITTTGRLARDYGYDDMETFDLFDLLSFKIDSGPPAMNREPLFSCQSFL